MSDTQTHGDTKYLFRRDKTWWVKLAVPRSLRDELGYDLRRSLHTSDIEAAREARWPVIEELRAKIDQIRASQRSAVSDKPVLKAVADDETEQAAPGLRQVDQHIV